MGSYGLIVFCIYFGVISYIIPIQWLTFDLYDRKFRLLPYGFRFVALFWLIITFILKLVFNEFLPGWDEFLLCNINVGLFIFFFTKQKEEDEFSSQIRLKAFAYSFTSIVALFGALSAINIADGDNTWSSFLLNGMLGGGLLIATLYFYITVYKLRKEKN